MKRALNFSLMDYQSPFVFDIETPIVGMIGGMRCGKSVSSCHKAIYLSAIHRGKVGVLLSPTGGMTQRNLVPIFRDLNERYELGIEGLEHKNPTRLEITWGGVKSLISLECSAESHGRLNGMTLAWGGLDEADKCAQDTAALAVEQLLFRTSNPTHPYPGQVFVTSTPEGHAFMADFFIEKANEMKKLYSASMTQNYLLPRGYIDKILAQIPAHKRKAYIEGLPIAFNQDVVYEEFDDVLNHTDLSILDWNQQEDVWVSFDINDGGMSVVIFFIRGKDIFVVDEWMGMQNTKAVIDKVKLQPWKDKAILTMDPASTQVFGFVQESRLKHRIMRAAPLIEHRVNAVNLQFCNALGQRHLYINTKKCKVLTRCLVAQGYVNGVPDKKTKVLEAKTDISGPVDALGYGIFLVRPWYAPGKATGPIQLRGL